MPERLSPHRNTLQFQRGPQRQAVGTHGALSSGLGRSLAALAQRQMRLNALIQDGQLWFGDDSDNVAVVKRGEIDAVLADLQGTTEKEKALEAAIANGATYMDIADEALESVEVKWVD